LSAEAISSQRSQFSFLALANSDTARAYSMPISAKLLASRDTVLVKERDHKEEDRQKKAQDIQYSAVLAQT